MARIAGVDLPREKRVEIGLTYIFGIGRSRSQKILKDADVNFDTRVKDLTEAELGRIRDEIQKYHIGLFFRTGREVICVEMLL